MSPIISYILWSAGALAVLTVAVLLLRKIINPRAVNIVNLLLATLAGLFAAAVLALSPRWNIPDQSALFARVMIGAFAAVWLASAIGLFFQKRVAWFGSIFCVGCVTCLMLTILFSVVVEIVHPRAEVQRDGSMRDGYIFACIFTLTWTILQIIVLVWLLTRLVRTFKHVFSPPRISLSSNS